MRKIHDRIGNDYSIKLAQVVPEHRQVVSFSFEIEFLKQTLPQADEHVSEFVTPSEFGVRIRNCATCSRARGLPQSARECSAVAL